MKIRTLSVLAFAVTLTACPGGSRKSGGGSPADTLTTRQRDSVIGESPLPGARGVRSALRIADSAAARTARIDSLGGS